MIKTINRKQFQSVGQLVIYCFKLDKNYPLTKLTVHVKKIAPESSWAKNEESAKSQYVWYKSAIKSGRIKTIIKSKA